MSDTSKLRSLLATGMAGVSRANVAQQAIQNERSGAYDMFVDAAILSGDAKVLGEVAESLFAEIRVSASVTDAEGNTYPINAKADKEGKGFTVPSSFTTAKSILLDALTRKIALTGEDGPRSYTSIRKDVKAAKDAEERERAKGDDRIRFDTLDMLAALTEAAKDATGADLADLYKRVKRAAKPASKAEGDERPAVSEQAEQVAQAA